MKLASLGQTVAALLLIALLCLGASANEVHQPGYLALDKQSDFAVYYTAASLIHNHRGSHLYDEAADGRNPQRREASAGGEFSAEARRHGVPKVDLYLYPPFLAQVLVPLTFLPIDKASLLWRLLGFGMIVVSAGCLTCLLASRRPYLCFLAVLTGFLCFSPLWQALHFGQITLVLLGTFTVGVLSYHHGWKRTSAIMFAMAALIKVTPLLLLFPMLVWRDWRWVRWFASAILVSLAVGAVFAAPGLIVRFLFNVMPAMSGGVVSRENQTVLSAVQMVWCRGRNVANLEVPRAILWEGKAGSVLLVAAGLWLLLPVGGRLPLERRAIVLISFVLLSLCAAPVAWIDTQIFGYLLVVLLYAELLTQQSSVQRLVLVSVCALGMGGSLALKNIPGIRGVTLLQFVPLMSSTVLTMYALATSERTLALQGQP